MTAEQFNKFWTSTYPGIAPIQHSYDHSYADRWFRIHSLPGSKRYAENENEWSILLERQNRIISDLLTENSNFLLVTGEYTSKAHIELHPFDEVVSVKSYFFVSLDPIDLHKLNPDQYEPGQFYTPKFSEQIWQAKKFDNLLKDIAEDNLKAFFVSRSKAILIAPYDGGVDFILKDSETRDAYKQKYSDWLSAREDGL